LIDATVERRARLQASSPRASMAFVVPARSSVDTAFSLTTMVKKSDPASCKCGGATSSTS
jgi:hypothetical protein